MAKNRMIISAIVSMLALFCIIPVGAQGKMDGIERDRLKMMLKNIKGAIKKDYYDPTFHGIDLDVRFKQAEDRLDQVTTTGQGFAVIAQALIDFNDSHLYFLPPQTNLDVDYGWQLTIYGDKCYVTLVRQKSDAEAKGLKVGDQVLAIEGFKPTKKELWKMMYYYNIVSKRPGVKMTVISPGDAQPRVLEIASKVKQRPKAITVELIADLFDRSGKSPLDYNYFTSVGGTMIWKMPSFSLAPSNIDTMMGKLKGSQNLILDLRGNGGGYVVTLERLASYIFDHDLKIADLKGRKELDPMRSKAGGQLFKGKLAVLIDADSGSAAEIFARLVQLEGRGKVYGDVSAGAVMQARSFGSSVGANDEVVYGASITHADVIMSDGKSIEHVGVIPDELVIPTGSDLASRRDPILAKALADFGITITAEDAGKLFIYTWKENSDIIVDVK